MDFDSSSKFISSLAKFLQSLCNGYVEFNNGVEVIGHIYLSVDTGKKIDYILNEKVCKTDENSVTFISNSFHAQPAEKPKPPSKNDPVKLSEAESNEEDIIIMEEPESKNVGTVPSTKDSFQQRQSTSPHSQRGRPAKRPHSQNFPHQRQSFKHSRSDLSSVGPNGSQLDTDSLHSESNSSSTFMQQTPLSGETTLAAATDSDISHLSKVFPQSFSDPSSNQLAAGERDVKPQLDSDMNVIQVKQEYGHSEHAEGEDESYDDSQDQSFVGMPYDQYYGDGSRQRGQRSDFGQMGGMNQGEYFQGGAGPSGEAGAGDSSGHHCDRQFLSARSWQPGTGCPVLGCSAKFCRNRSDLRMHWLEKHEEITAYYHCAVCTNVSFKRKSNLVAHIRLKHGGNSSDFIGKIEYQANQEFLDPRPLTLSSVLGYS